MVHQRRGDMVRVLPRGQQYDHGGVRVEGCEQIAAFFLATDKAVTAAFIHRMGASHAIAQFFQRRFQALFK